VAHACLSATCRREFLAKITFMFYKKNSNTAKESKPFGTKLVFFTRQKTYTYFFHENLHPLTDLRIG
jgi:hypothetical protein